MARNISRNAPCPCGSGRKFKHCCINKGIDWEARRRPASVLPALPRPKGPSADFVALNPYRVVDAKLKEVARASPEVAEWKVRVEPLSPVTPDRERLEAYRLVRQAGVLPDDAAGFLFDHALPWQPDDEDDPNRLTLAVLRRHGQDDLADLYVSDRQEYDRRRERGRQFFFGPPDEEWAAYLRTKGVID